MIQDAAGFKGTCRLQADPVISAPVHAGGYSGSGRARYAFEEALDGLDQGDGVSDEGLAPLTR